MKKNILIITAFILSILSLIFNTEVILRIIDTAIILIILFELFQDFRHSDYRRQFILKNIKLIIFTSVYLLTLICLFILDHPEGSKSLFYLIVIAIRSLYLIYRGFESIKSIEQALIRLNDRPALSIISSFFAVIMLGTLLLMLPFSTAGENSLRFIDAWFTATSAVCVTGLIVVDTATAFSIAGKIIILVLIQIGGLGIMIITYFSMFVLGRKVTIEEKQRLSFVISDSDISGIISTLKKIVYFTFTVEAFGSVLLTLGLGLNAGFNRNTVFSAVFHSISAFCNAGFSLFSDSLEGFVSNPLVLFTISALIIIGGLSFAVIFNIRNFLNPVSRVHKLNLNSRVVLSWTAVLLVAGFFIFYAAEHGNSLRAYSTGTQYLSAFFQSVTLRTAGFNSIPFSNFTTGTLLVMCFFMFIGAASGSTAGGIKINTAAVIFAYLKSIVINSPKASLYQYQLSRSRVLRAFTVLIYGIMAIFIGITALAFTQEAPLKDILFETVSAFGTVGLSTGVTSGLNSFGKLVIIFLMFNGRLGPLTILSTFASGTENSAVRHPRGNILIG